MNELTGINLAMQTPMDVDGNIDYVRAEELIDIYIDSGVHGLVLGAGTGQHPYLTQQECIRLYELGAARINGRCKLIFQTSALVLDELLERSKHAQGLGAMELWSRMIPSLLYIWRGNYIPKVKAASRLRGFDGGGVRAPLQDLSVNEERELAACLEPLG
jgi:dihydrodipicolinate synthase/N-acetylneuraminate lyase